MKNELVKIRTGKISDYFLCLPLFKTLYHGDIGSNFQQIFEDYVEEGVIFIAEKHDKVIGVLAGSFQLDIDWEGKTIKLDVHYLD